MFDRTLLASWRLVVVVCILLVLHVRCSDAAAQEVTRSSADGGPRYWQVTQVETTLNLRAEPGLDARVVSRYPSGTILHNLGCRYVETRVWCDVQAVGGGPRGYVAAEYVAHAHGPDGALAYGSGDSAERAGRSEFDATGEIHCGSEHRPDIAACRFGVARDTNGDATVVVTRPSGQTRALFFAFGRPIGADTAEADGYHEFHAHELDDTYVIHVGPEHYTVPSALVLGG